MGEETQENSLSELDSSQLEMMKEMCMAVDENDRVIDSVSKIDCHRGKGIRHRAFSVLILVSEDRLLMQQRSSEKITFPGIWANSCCSHPLDIENENGDPVEGVIHASKRKMLQELGGGTLVGPYLVGFKESIQIAPLGANVADIVNLAALSAFKS